MNDIAAIVLSVVAVLLALVWNPLVAWVRSAMAHAGPLSPVPPAVAWPTPTADFSFALDALAVVRNRLVDTGCLDEPAKAAIEAVTHALISGTDK
jgi:hypothetical protein